MMDPKATKDNEQGREILEGRNFRIDIQVESRFSLFSKGPICCVENAG